jgi:uncharacterized membrane protein
VNEFIGECRKEWQRLGVPDPVANEMAADLTADIDEAEAEGGSAEDVLGNSLFDPQHFAASWAEARGVTSTPSTPSTPSTAPRRSLSRRQIAAAALAALAVVLVMGALVLGIGHQSASVAMSVRKILGPGSVHWFGAGPATPPARVFVSGPSFAVGHGPGPAIVAVGLLLAGVVVLGLAVFYWAPWARRHSK